MKIQLYNDDCLNAMKNIPDKSVDLVLCDLPYGITSCKWDCCIDLEALWKEYKRIITDTGVIALFGDASIFMAKLISSNEKMYKYSWIWKKTYVAGGLLAKYQPLRNLESISIFYKNAGQYYPQMGKGKSYTKIRNENLIENNITNSKIKRPPDIINKTERYPTLILEGKQFSLANTRRLHPNQKAVPLLEYLIKTYTEEGMTVLDNCMGSGSTMVACINTNRNGIGIELDNDYFNISKTRIEEAKNDLQ